MLGLEAVGPLGSGPSVFTVLEQGPAQLPNSGPGPGDSQEVVPSRALGSGWSPRAILQFSIEANPEDWEPIEGLGGMGVGGVRPSEGDQVKNVSTMRWVSRQRPRGIGIIRTRGGLKEGREPTWPNDAM